jgi:archaellum biogenesis protein FlaJ (TadC family)
MAEWDLISIGRVLAGSSLSVAGIIIAAVIIGVNVPYGAILILTCIMLTVMSTGTILFYQQYGPDAEKSP